MRSSRPLAPTGAPQNVRVTASRPGELQVSWSTPPQDSWNGELLGYVVSWREIRVDSGEEAAEDEEGGAGGAGRVAVRGWSSSQLAVEGLRSFARYALSARAYNRAGAGPHSPTLYATTADGGDALTLLFLTFSRNSEVSRAVPETAPRGVACEALSARSLRVRWAPLSAAHAHALRGYDLHYAPLHASSGQHPVPEAVERVRALAASAAAVRVCWLPPAGAGRLTHYTLYSRERAKVGGEWVQRVDVAAEDGETETWQEEVCRDVRGLRESTVYELWVRAANAAGAGPPSRPVAAAPAPALSARISSFSRVVSAAWGARVRLRCSALGAPPLRWRWAPLPTHSTVTDDGDLIIHKAEASLAGNYTCTVRNGLGSDSLSVALQVRAPPAPPAPRLRTTAAHALQLSWDKPNDGGAHILGYTVWWSRGEGAGRARARLVPAADTSLRLARLACGALYRVTLQAHNALGASPHSAPLLARTRGQSEPLNNTLYTHKHIIHVSNLEISILQWPQYLSFLRQVLRLSTTINTGSPDYPLLIPN
ncbi:hypothetical protein HF086_015255 [Spodoptera exigua]|uniref:Down syndrome cell adhesion molecule-like protein Dscam2 n=1 Tax=Spodoptera exigua TaxID=7107 RepID=A0A922SGI2_SPOEX|nr:hypothetical protein HF086_015255 [Spodoptera exigua]